MPTALEDKFILHWRAASAEGRLTKREITDYDALRDHSTWSRFVSHELLYWADAPWEDLRVLTPTPRGADLLATADAIGYDPAAKPDSAPEMPPCPDCNGAGRKPLGIAHMGADPEHVCELDYTCTTCKGRREMQAPQAPKMRNAINALFQGQRLVVGGDLANGLDTTTYMYNLEGCLTGRTSSQAPDANAHPDFLPPMNPKRLRTDSSGNVRLTFGKHSGLPLKKVPSGYLNWAVRESFCKSLVAHCTAELARRDRAK